MREFKFRYWDDTNKAYLMNQNMPTVMGDVTERILVLSGYDNDVFEQYTGLKDKNGKKGKEIYGGDIFKFGKHKAEVIFKNGGFGYMYMGEFISFSAKSDLDDFLSQLEIIGNIHENPELLEG